jgi:hypothetical protein
MEDDMPRSNRTLSLLSATVLAVGLVGAGVAAGQGLVEARRVDRFVTVKGVAEREVEADLAFWAITVSVPGDAIGVAQAEIDDAVARVLDFLEEFGLAAESVSRQGTQVTDRATQYNAMDLAGARRFVVSQTLLVRSTDVEAVHAASQAVGRLIQAGVPLTSANGYGYSRPTYTFTGLVDIKPAMIAEATGNARAAAQQFADDSGGALGGIRRANQGVFVIGARDSAPGVDEAAQRYKQVRVVTTVEYYLRD